MIKKLLLILFTGTFSFSFAQNIVQNPGFEDLNNEPCGISMTPSDFDNSVSFWSTANLGTPDVFLTTVEQSCWNFQPNSTFSGIPGLKGPQDPHNGDSFIGLFAYTIDGFNQRDYIQVQLSSPMVEGNEYIVEFYVSLADSTELSVDNVGALLSVNPVSSLDDEVIEGDPQVQFESFVADVENWVRIADTIVADGAYDYITIGNFNDDSNTNTQENEGGGNCIGCYGAYYFIDDVSVTEYISTGIDEISTNKLSTAYPNPFTNEVSFTAETPLRDVSVFIHDASGKIIFSEQLIDGVKFSIDLSTLSKGVYFMAVMHSEDMQTMRLIKVVD